MVGKRQGLECGITSSLNLSFLSEMVMTFALNVVGELILVLGYGTWSVTHLAKLTLDCVTETQGMRKGKAEVSWCFSDVRL